MRGETGDGRELQPLKFPLVCPTCGTSKECAKVRLFTNVAKGLTCSTCRKSTTSTRWSCFHGTPWTDCPVCRQVGFRCGSQSLRNHPNRSRHVTNMMHLTVKALRRKQAKLRVIGALGEPKRLQAPRYNSAGSLPNRRTMVQKENIKRRRERPPPKGEGKENQLDAQTNSSRRLGCSKSEHDIHHDYYMHGCSSSLWQAHAASNLPRGNTSSDSNKCSKHSYPQTGSEGASPHSPAKKARLCKAFSSRKAACKGNCPDRWTIESYCEHCHG